MSPQSTSEQRQRPPLAERSAVVGPRGIRLATLLLAALCALTLALVSRAEAYVYWTNSAAPDYPPVPGSIGRANPDGSGVKQRFLHGVDVGGDPRGVAVDGTHLYWANYFDNTPGGSIGRFRIDGTGGLDRIDPGPPIVDFPNQVAVDDAHIYVANETAGVGPPFLLGRVNLDGTGAEAFIDTEGSTYGVAVNATHVYWSYGRTIGRANLDGTGIDRSFIDIRTRTCGGLALDDTHLYWTVCREGEPDEPLDSIGRANLDGTSVNERFITGALTPCGVAVDAAHVYWANLGPDVFPPSQPGTIGRANLDGSGVDQRFITGADTPCGVAVDDLPFTFSKVKRNRKRGTGKLTLIVPGPGDLTLAKTGKVKRAKERAEVEGSVKLPVKPRGKARKKLNMKGYAKVKANVTFTPDGGEPNTQSKRVRLVKRR